MEIKPAKQKILADSRDRNRYLMGLFDPAGNYFSEIVQAEYQQDTKAGQEINMHVHRTGTKNPADGWKVENRPGKNQLYRNAKQHQPVAKNSPVQAGTAGKPATKQVANLHQQDGS